MAVIHVQAPDFPFRPRLSFIATCVRCFLICWIGFCWYSLPNINNNWSKVAIQKNYTFVQIQTISNSVIFFEIVGGAKCMWYGQQKHSIDFHLNIRNNTYTPHTKTRNGQNCRQSSKHWKVDERKLSASVNSSIKEKQLSIVTERQ